MGMRAALFVAFLGLSCVASQPASAKPIDVIFDPAICSFGEYLDTQFDELQSEHDAGLATAGFLYRHPDAELSQDFEVTRKLKVEVGPLQISAIGISFERRYVYIADDIDPVRQYAEAQGFYRPNPQGFGGEVILPDGSDAPDATIFATEDYVYDQVQRKTVAVYPDYGRSGIGCSFPEFSRLAAKAGMALEEYARFRPDPAVWSREIARSHEAAEKARDAGDYDSAANASRHVLELLDARGAAPTVEYSVALDSHGQSLSALGRKREALALYERARDLSAQVAGLRHLRTTRFLGHYAETLNELDPGDDAWWQLNFVDSQYYDLFGQTDRRRLAAASAESAAMGDLILAGKESMLDLDEVRYDIQLLAELSAENLGPEDSVTDALQFNLAVVNDKLGDMRAAITGIHTVSARRFERYGPQHLLTTRAVSIETDMLLRVPQMRNQALVAARLVTDAWRKRREMLATSARDEVQRARELIGQRRDFHALAESAWWMKESHPERLEHLREEALTALQDAMAGSADRAVALSAARKALGEAGDRLADLATRRQTLSDEWSSLEDLLTRLLVNGDAVSKRASLSQRQKAIQAEIDGIDETLRGQAPQYFAFIRPHTLSQAQVQAMLADDEAVLVTVPTRYATHVVAISKNSIEWHRSDWDEERLGSAVRRLLWDVGANVDVSALENATWASEGEGAYPYDRGTAWELYRELIEPIAPVLAGKSHVFVATGGALSGLPFAILVTSEPHGADGDPAALRATDWLADAHALVQIPSLQSLKAMREAARRRTAGDDGDGFIGFGDPLLDGKGSNRGGNRIARRGGALISATSTYFQPPARGGERVLANVASLRALASLPGTARELSLMADAFEASPDTLFTGARATEGNLRHLDMANVRILALATHGLLSGEIGGDSQPGLVFTPPTHATLDDDGLLTTSEIAGLILDADWVILSACNTAAGNGKDGEPALSGIARSFFYAGARNLLASHWPVRDEVAPLITVRTVELQREEPSLSRAQAFQRAMREVRMNAAADSDVDTWAHPNAWAPFVLVGDR